MNWLSMQRLRSFTTYHIYLHGVEECFGDCWNEFAKDKKHAKIFADDAEGKRLGFMAPG